MYPIRPMYMTSDQDDDCLITVRYVGAIFYLRWSPTHLAAAPDLLQYYMRHLEELREEGEDHNGLDLVQPFIPLMDQLAPKSKQAPFSLHDYLYPQWFQLKATIDEGGWAILPEQEENVEPPFCPPGLALCSNQMRSLDLNTWVPRCVSSHEIELPANAEEHPLLHIPTKVILKESQTECFFKGLGAGYTGSISEIAAFRTVAEATGNGSLASDARICRLHGLVVDTLGKHKMQKRVVGMLLNYISPKRRGILGTLQCVAYEESSRKHLRRWADELERQLSDLHGAGCIWGDAKPENLLVDINDNVWFIDFGGGYTPGWVEKDQQHTQGGDLAAMKKIRQWLEDLETLGNQGLRVAQVEPRTDYYTKLEIY